MGGSPAVGWVELLSSEAVAGIVDPGFIVIKGTLCPKHRKHSLQERLTPSPHPECTYGMGGLRGVIHLRLKPPAEENTKPAGRVFYVQPVDSIHRLVPISVCGDYGGGSPVWIQSQSGASSGIRFPSPKHGSTVSPRCFSRLVYNYRY